MNTKRYKSPLTLYVYWADSFTPGAEMAQAVYEAFCRDPEEPESRSLGIPVRFRSARGMPDAPNSDRVLRLIIVDTTMVNSSVSGQTRSACYSQQVRHRAVLCRCLSPTHRSES